MTQLMNPEAFTPGEYIREEIEARGWSQLDLADILGRHPQVVSEIITGKRSITPETAVGLADAFGTSAQLWLNLESAYQLSKVSARQASDSTVSRRARLYEIAPIKDMQRRGWIERPTSVDVLESQVLHFFGIQSLEEEVQFRHAARKSTDYDSITSGQLAWLCRARHLACAVSVTAQFSDQSFQAALSMLAKLKSAIEEIRHVPKVLVEAGIRFLVVEHLPSTKIDGVCFWLDARSPVIAISMRYDRIDWFWHTLMHEMAHVKNKDGLAETTIDTQLVGSDAQPFGEKPEAEKRADAFAVNFLLDQASLHKFIARVHPLYSRVEIIAFARSQAVHPGIVVGQLHQINRDGAKHRSMLERVKHVITASALTDGWGQVVRI